MYGYVYGWLCDGCYVDIRVFHVEEVVIGYFYCEDCCQRRCGFDLLNYY